MQFGRKALLRVGAPGKTGREWSDLRLSFLVQASDKTQPNRLQAKIYNLSDDSVAFLQSAGLVVEMRAGFETPLLLGVGELTRVETTWQGPDRITTLECADGRQGFTSQLNMSMAGKTSAKGVIKEIGKKMGFGETDLQAIDDLELPRGFAASGKASDSLDDLTRSVGADWHIEQGGLVILPRGKPSTRTATLLRADTGLIGTPQRTDEGIKITCLLNPHIRTRSIVRVESREVEGFYMTRSYKHLADTHADAWHTEIEATRIND